MSLFRNRAYSANWGFRRLKRRLALLSASAEVAFQGVQHVGNARDSGSEKTLAVHAAGEVEGGSGGDPKTSYRGGPAMSASRRRPRELTELWGTGPC